MRKASEGPRGKTRRGAPKTIDLAADAVSEKRNEESAQAARQSEPSPEGGGMQGDEGVRPAEPVGMPETEEGGGVAEGPDAARMAPGATSGFGGGPAPGPADVPEKGPEEGLEAESAAQGAAQGERPEIESRPKQSGIAAMFGAGMFSAGLAGALIALFLLGGLNQAGLLRHVPLVGGLASGEETAASIAAMTAQMAALDKRLAAIEETVGGDMPAEATAALSRNIDALGQRIAAAEQAIGDLQAAEPARGGAAAELSASLDALAARLDGVERELALGAETGAAAGPGAEPGAVQALGERVDAIAKAGESLTAGLEAVTGRIETLTARMSALGKDVAALGQAQSQEAREQAAARAIAGEALATAYRRGEAFAGLLASVEELSGRTQAIAALKPHAAAGVATDEALKREFGGLAGRMLDATVPEGDGVIDRLIANARSLVEARPAGPVEGDTPEAIVSRIEADLERGALNAALEEWRSLPEPARSASVDWGDKLEKRVEADRFLREVLAGLGQADAAKPE